MIVLLCCYLATIPTVLPEDLRALELVSIPVAVTERTIRDLRPGGDPCWTVPEAMMPNETGHLYVSERFQCHGSPWGRYLMLVWPLGDDVAVNLRKLPEYRWRLGDGWRFQKRRAVVHLAR